MGTFYNYLLFVPSLLSKNQTITYSVEEWTGRYLGMQTNEAVTKYLIDYTDAQDEKLDKIIMLCTDEVANKRLPQISEQTTLEYYREEILKFIGKRGIVTDAENLFEVIPYHPQNNEDVGKIIEPLKGIIQTASVEKADHKRVFVDFTGGSRTAAMTLVFACKILQSYGITVDKILYSNIIRGQNAIEGIIEECTRTYKLFDYLTAELEVEYGKVDKIQNLLEDGLDEKEKGLIKDLVENYKTMQKAKKTNQFQETVKGAEIVKKKSEAIKESLKSYPGKNMMERIKGESDTIIQNKNQLELLLTEKMMKEENYVGAINLFREKGIHDLLENNIISVGNRFRNKESGEINENYVLDEMIGVYYYYGREENGKKQSRNTFMDTVKRFLRLLSQDLSVPPMEILDTYFGKEFYDLNQYMDNIPKRSLAHNSFSRKKCYEKIFPLMKNYHVGELEEGILRYDRLEQIYTGYGFPFACTYNNQLLDKYDELYKKNLENGALSLQRYYNGHKNHHIAKVLRCFPDENFTYESLIMALQKPEYERMLHVLFPYQLSRYNIWSEAMNMEKWDDFVYTFIKIFCDIKDTRNKLIHPSDLQKEAFEKTLEDMENMMNWIRKYTKKKL